MNNHEIYLNKIKDKCLKCHQCHCYHHDSLIGKYCFGDIANKLLNEINNEQLYDSILGCNECGLCLRKCPNNFDIKELQFHLRGLLLEKDNCLCKLYEPIRVDKTKNIFTKIREENNSQIEDDLNNKNKSYKNLFWPGCHMSASFPELTKKVFELLKQKNIVDGLTIKCCGNPLFASGQYKPFTKYIKDIKDILQKHNVETIITSCPSCYDFLNRVLDIKVECLSEILVKNNFKIVTNKTIAFHDSCPDRLNGIFSASIRELYKNVNVHELAHIKHNTICCGSGGLVPFYDKRISNDASDFKINEIRNSNCDYVVTTCFNCYKNLKNKVEIHHYLQDLIESNN